MKRDNGQNDKFSGTYWKYTGAGFELVGSLAIFLLIGYFIDKRWGTTPKGMIIGAVTGIVVGLYLLLKEALKMNKNMPDEGYRGPESTPTEEEKYEQRDDDREQKR